MCPGFLPKKYGLAHLAQVIKKVIDVELKLFKILELYGIRKNNVFFVEHVATRTCLKNYFQK